MQQALQKQLMCPQVMEVVAKIEDSLKSVPHLPEGLTKFLVKIAPWLALLGGIGGILGGLSTLTMRGQMNQTGVGVMAEVMAQLADISPAYFILTGLISIASGVLLLLAFKPLREKKLLGWVYLFWNMVLSVVQSVLGVVMAYGSVVGAVIGLLIGVYILFEVKPHFKKK
ncbi:MAG: hypothetical protein GF390_02020 [Candidatus Pacebacteria bacterium]|nr:hypothetical protein [Candidatus Paceibacterota bacterium]